MDLLLIERTLAWLALMAVAIIVGSATRAGVLSTYADRWSGWAMTTLCAGLALHQLYFWVGHISVARGHCYEVGWIDPLCAFARQLYTGHGIAHVAYAMVIAGAVALIVRPFVVAIWWGDR